jgi:hypothetical protein
MTFRRGILLACLAVGACANNPLPPPNSIRTNYDVGAQIIQVYISNAQMPRNAWLVDATGTRYPLPLTLVSNPHVNYSEPPSIGLGFGVFGWNVGGGTGVGIPLGSPYPTGVDDQFIASTRFAAPSDYPEHWSQYRIFTDIGVQTLEVPAPAPS